MGEAMRVLTIFVMMAVVVTSLSACGRKGRPIPPEGAVTRQYPDIQFPEQQAPARAQDKAGEGTASGAETNPQ
jgi:predicted small lipoprotein YifL